MSAEPEIVEGGPELLERIGPLWEKLREHHAACAPEWAESIRSRKFAIRAEEIRRGAREGIRVLLAQDNLKDIGYAVMSIAGNSGELVSIFVDQAYRGVGLGERMVEMGIAWLRENGVVTVIADVLHSNEDALRFYQGNGFKPRTVRFLKDV